MTTPSSSTAPARVKRPDFRLACCLCRKPIPRPDDVHALDEEWQRRYPEMVGTLACTKCAIHRHSWDCQTATGQYVPGHLPARRPGRTDLDAWSHLEGCGTHVAMALSYPWSAVQQGAEEYLRWVLVARPRLDGDIAQLIRAALARWDAQGRRA